MWRMEVKFFEAYQGSHFFVERWAHLAVFFAIRVHTYAIQQSISKILGLATRLAAVRPAAVDCIGQYKCDNESHAA